MPLAFLLGRLLNSWLTVAAMMREGTLEPAGSGDFLSASYQYSLAL